MLYEVITSLASPRFAPTFIASLLSLVLLVLTAGCATFGIVPAAREDGREGRNYAMLVRAWDKKAGGIAVVFNYRVNGGSWKEMPGTLRGDLYEGIVPGAELPAGTLEYYALMKNHKGEDVNSGTVRVRILSFAEANRITSYNVCYTKLLRAVIVALGNESNPLMKQTTEGLDVTKRGNIVVDSNQRTSLKKVWAGGDIVLGAATVILAMGEGRKAAASINAYLAGDDDLLV